MNRHLSAANQPSDWCSSDPTSSLSLGSPALLWNSWLSYKRVFVAFRGGNKGFGWTRKHLTEGQTVIAGRVVRRRAFSLLFSSTARVYLHFPKRNPGPSSGRDAALSSEFRAQATIPVFPRTASALRLIRRPGGGEIVGTNKVDLGVPA